MKMTIAIAILSFLFFSCNSKELESNNAILDTEINNLKKGIKIIKKDILILKRSNSKLLLTNINKLMLFDPNGLKIKLHNIRPIKDDNNYLCVPAAFTNRENSIDGLFIENGNMISSAINKNLNGVCIISNNKVQFINSVALNENLVNEVIAKKSSLFQQQLLVLNSEIIKCDLFKGRLNLRRAIIEINNSFYLIESLTKISILEFQTELISIQVKNAIYLDMGTYSEGWYRDNNKIISIGETMEETDKQSNWIVFESL